MQPRNSIQRAARRHALAAILSLVLLPQFGVPAFAAPEAVTGGVRFTYTDPTAGSVNWVGAFNGWNTSANPMAQGADGSWSIVLALPPGEHEYKFFVNGANWLADPENPLVAGPDANSVVKVGADGRLTASAATTASKFNPKIGVGGRIRNLYESIYDPVTKRYELTRPEFDVDVGFDIKMSDILKAHWLMNINPAQENVQDFRSRLNFKRGSMFLAQPGLSLLAFDSENIGTWDDPLALVGGIGVFDHPFGYQHQGVKLNATRAGFDVEAIYSDNFDDRLTSNSDLYQGYRIDNFPTYWVGLSKDQPTFRFEYSDLSAALDAIANLRTYRTTPESAPTPGFAMYPGQGAKVMTTDIGDNGKLFGFGDNGENTFALRLRRKLSASLSAGLLGRTDRGFGYGRMAYAKPVGDSLVRTLKSLYAQEWFGGGGEVAWAPAKNLRLYGEALGGARRMNFVNGSVYYTWKLTQIDAAGPRGATFLRDSALADGDHMTTDESVRFKLGGDWTLAQGDIGLHASLERETHVVPLWTQAPVTPAGAAPLDHVRVRTVDFQRAQYFDPDTKLNNAAVTSRLAWDRNWRYYLNREVKTTIDLEWTNFDYDRRTGWENQLWFPTGNFWLESGNSVVTIDRMTLLGEKQAIRIRPTLELPLQRRRDMRFTYRGTFSTVELGKQPRYVESIFSYGFDLTRTVRLSSDTRWAKYNAPTLSLGHGYVSEFAELLFRVAPGVQFSFGWGVDPDVLDPNTNEYAPIGRDVFLNDRNVNGFIAETNNLSLTPQIAAAEKLLQNEKRIEIQAIVHF